MPPKSAWEHLVHAALAEDLGPGDATSELLVPPDRRGRARIEARQALVVCGLEVARCVFEHNGIALEGRAVDGEAVAAGARIASVAGSVRGILAGERVALNFLQRLSGIATAARLLCEAVRGTEARILDTRKTTPGWRALEKFAVRCGGAHNHRQGLFDGILIKDNHIAAVGGVAEAVRRARAGAPPGLRVEVEVESVEQAREALEAGAEVLLVDNQPPSVVEEVVKLARGRVPVEASGGMRLENVAQYARAGARWISVGALTHSAPAVDLALEWEGPSAA
jgi:nicotinate-nucleotide pyrophosphorylase (carboxylating)